MSSRMDETTPGQPPAHSSQDQDRRDLARLGSDATPATIASRGYAGVDDKVKWRHAVTFPLPPVTLIASWLIIRRLGGGNVTALGLAVLVGLFTLATVAIIEHERTLRARLDCSPANLLALAEAHDRSRYARAQTRRFLRLSGGEKYVPDTATNVIELLRAAHGSMNDRPVASDKRAPEQRSVSPLAAQSPMATRSDATGSATPTTNSDGKKPVERNGQSGTASDVARRERGQHG